jgi:Zn-dependent alcohol dehydrogenase
MLSLGCGWCSNCEGRRSVLCDRWAGYVRGCCSDIRDLVTRMVRPLDARMGLGAELTIVLMYEIAVLVLYRVVSYLIMLLFIAL